jgi:hypothetical protein
MGRTSRHAARRSASSMSSCHHHAGIMPASCHAMAGEHATQNARLERRILEVATSKLYSEYTSYSSILLWVGQPVPGTQVLFCVLCSLTI